MKKLITILFVIATIAANAQLTLSEKSALANNPVFVSRMHQGLYSKANFWRGQSNPANLKAQKQQNYARVFLNGAGNSIDIISSTRFWLANYNGVAVLDSNNQPVDNEILNTAALDVVYDLLAGVLPGDESKPIVP